MTEAVKLYDLTERDYPSRRGDRFRSLQIFECWVCGALSNGVVMGGNPGYGVRVVCPNASECWHHELQNKIEWLNNPHPKSYKDELQREVDEIKKTNRENVKNNLEGNLDMTLPRKWVTNTFSYNPTNSCKHRF